jgi:hypothetical protein
LRPTWKRTDQVNPWNRQQFADLLKPEFDLAASNDRSHGLGLDRHALAPELLGDTSDGNDSVDK